MNYQGSSSLSSWTFQISETIWDILNLTAVRRDGYGGNREIYEYRLTMSYEAVHWRVINVYKLQAHLEKYFPIFTLRRWVAFLGLFSGPLYQLDLIGAICHFGRCASSPWPPTLYVNRYVISATKWLYVLNMKIGDKGQ